MRRLILSLFSICMGILAWAQSISGNLNAAGAARALAYGNVDIYRGDELVASVLADREGRFRVALDTGLYRCVVSYDGFVASTRMVHVTADEKADFAMARDPAAPLPDTLARRRASGRAMAMRAAEASVAMDGPGGALLAAPRIGRRPAEGREVRSGILSAGEVNDFAKWELWTDLSATVLAEMRRAWAIAPQGRYALGLQDNNGLPIADAAVRLEKPDGTVLSRARTDNTGKAELWAALDTARRASEGPLALVVSHGGATWRLERAQPIAQGMNRLVLDVPCGPSSNVDVAFVVDATGSMQDELDFLQAELNEIVYRSKRIGDRLSFRFANVFYRDEGADEEYLTRTMPFTRVLSKAVNFISAQQADGGGDTPEAVEVALDSAINRLAWSEEARARILFLVLDAGPHNTPAIQARMRALAAQAAAKGIRIVPVAASGIERDTEYLLRTLALSTNGTYTFLTDHSGVGLPHLEPATDRYDPESLSGLLTRILKSYTYMPDCLQEIPELELDLPDSVVTYRPDSTAGGGAANVPEPEGGAAIRWSYYPNPTTGIVHITADRAIPELYITDLSGKALQVIKGLEAGRTVAADLSAYATGIYLIRCPVGEQWISGRVVLQRT